MVKNMMKAIGIAGKVLPAVKKGKKVFKILRRLQRGKRGPVARQKKIHPKKNIGGMLGNAKAAAKTTGSIYFRIGNLLWKRR